MTGTRGFPFVQGPVLEPGQMHLAKLLVPLRMLDLCPLCDQVEKLHSLHDAEHAEEVTGLLKTIAVITLLQVINSCLCCWKTKALTTSIP